MNKKPTIVAERLNELRESIHISQSKLASQFKNVEQSAIFRYENAQSFPPYYVLMQYAEYFDVSLDYIFGRTDKPQCKLYENQPKVVFEDEHMKDFIEMCFNPKSPANAKLKEALLKLLKEDK